MPTRGIFNLSFLSSCKGGDPSLIEQLLEDSTDLEADDIRAVLTFAADRERKLSSAPPP